MILTSSNRNINRWALEANISAAKQGAQQASTCSIALLLDLVAAVQLRITAGLDSLLDGDVAGHVALVGSGATGVLAFVADVLVTVRDLCRVGHGGDLAGDEGWGTDGEGEGEDGDDWETHFGCGGLGRR